MHAEPNQPRVWVALYKYDLSTAATRDVQEYYILPLTSTKMFFPILLTRFCFCFLFFALAHVMSCITNIICELLLFCQSKCTMGLSLLSKKNPVSLVQNSGKTECHSSLFVDCTSMPHTAPGGYWSMSSGWRSAKATVADH